MKRLLVPTDFSPNATKALNYAVQLAKAAKADITLIHAIEANQQQEAKGAAKEKLKLLRKSIAETEAVSIYIEVVTDSSVNSILNSIDKFRPHLVVMGTMGNSGLKEKVYGSRTGLVIGKSPVPVMAIPLLSDWKAPVKILLAVNSFNIPDRILKPVITIATLFASSIQVTVFTDTDDDYVEDFAEHEKKIAVFRDSLKGKYPGAEIHAVHLAGRRFRESLQNWIDSNQVDLLVMLTHKRTLIGSIFNSSMTKKMSYHINIPLLAIPDNGW
jgi:nucleotide-binding universal stress UspA family protein